MGIPRPIGQRPIVYEQADLSLLPEVDFKLEGKFFNVNATDAGKAFMIKRGFTSEHLDKFNVKYLKYGKSFRRSDPSDQEFWRFYNETIIVPIYEAGTMLCFEARQLANKEKWEEANPGKKFKKVLYPKNGSTRTLWQIDRLKRDQTLFVVEGLMDAISLRTHPDFQNSTATFGASINERQIYLLGLFKRVCVIPNNDLAGLASLKKMLDKKLNNVFVLPLPMSVNDVSDVLQKKDPRWKSLFDLQSMGWYNESKLIPLSEFNITGYINRLG